MINVILPPPPFSLSHSLRVLNLFDYHTQFQTKCPLILEHLNSHLFILMTTQNLQGLKSCVINLEKSDFLLSSLPPLKRFL